MDIIRIKCTPWNPMECGNIINPVIRNIYSTLLYTGFCQIGKTKLVVNLNLSFIASTFLKPNGFINA
jgi:hypothetical protein